MKDCRKSDDFIVPKKVVKATGGKSVARRKSCKSRIKNHTQGWATGVNTARPAGAI